MSECDLDCACVSKVIPVISRARLTFFATSAFTLGLQSNSDGTICELTISVTSDTIATLNGFSSHTGCFPPSRLRKHA